jgi:hypothetical protein
VKDEEARASEPNSSPDRKAATLPIDAGHPSGDHPKVAAFASERVAAFTPESLAGFARNTHHPEPSTALSFPEPAVPPSPHIVGTTPGDRGSRPAKLPSAARAALTPSHPGVGRLVGRGGHQGCGLLDAGAKRSEARCSRRLAVERATRLRVWLARAVDGQLASRRQ